MGKTHPDQQYITALLTNNQVLIGQIYSKFFGKIKRYIVNNNGSEDDAADIFQEALIDIYQQAKHKAFVLTCPLEPFLLMVCKRKWLNELKKRAVIPVTNQSDDLLSIGEDVFAQAEELLRQDEEARHFADMFKKLGERCQEIIRHSLTGEAQEKIAETLGVTYGYLRKKKSECMATLIQLIQKSKVKSQKLKVKS
ncbi:sigma-70 family RNA polymerase sigma factor [Pedobacter sp. BS3]|uniref:RNA polymerase sigma factor n=1 Tax=Pedobacter sp. BS3 TaxID=2567937 RepID=UPI0011EF8416|nr:sigma-70 family RNA polymerase sigma factor [Pedobacter sp. BS3]TZF81532.1 sigma-70 family RNA polymerase sigma factor [Pedobacter sp. BS3]